MNIVPVTRKEKRLVEVDVDVHQGYSLTLDNFQASVLMEIVSNVGGLGPNKQVINELYNTLHKQGFRYSGETKYLFGAEQIVVNENNLKLGE